MCSKRSYIVYDRNDANSATYIIIFTEKKARACTTARVEVQRIAATILYRFLRFFRGIAKF